MKCNKCLKVIPKGEEIRMYGNGGRSSDKASYGGNYCEACWKTKFEYKIFEDGKITTTNNNNEKQMPVWGWVVISVFAILFLITLGLLLTEKRQRN